MGAEQEKIQHRPMEHIDGFTMRLRTGENVLVDFTRRRNGYRMVEFDKSKTKPVEALGGRLKLFVTNHTVEVDGVDIQLTPQEQWVLRSLVRHQGEILSREKILSEAWENNPKPGAVEYIISNLRKKLSPDLIETVRGKGYRLGTEPITEKIRHEAGSRGNSKELTRRQKEVLLIIAKGNLQRRVHGSIARELSIATSTARKHVEAIYEKLGANNALYAILTAIRDKVISADEIKDERVIGLLPYLTPNEKRVLSEMSLDCGAHPKRTEVAARMGLSVSTVRTHQEHICDQLSTHIYTAAVNYRIAENAAVNRESAL